MMKIKAEIIVKGTLQKVGYRDLLSSANPSFKTQTLKESL